MFKLVLLLCMLLPTVFTDEIRIYEPTVGGLYHPEDIMDIRYAGKKIKKTFLIYHGLTFFKIGQCVPWV